MRAAISDDVFPGGRLPTTVDLSEQPGVGRATIRLALDTLQNEGLLVKHCRRGTFISAQEVPTKLVPTSMTLGTFKRTTVLTAVRPKS